jgi:O-antigen/teichoic acid export membrane protein
LPCGPKGHKENDKLILIDKYILSKNVFKELNVLRLVCNFNELAKAFSDPIFKNTITIIFTSLVSSCFGFIFWLLAAKLYDQNDVGIATVLISSISILIVLSRLGLDTTIIRYIPEEDKSNIFNTSIIITTVFSILVGTIFIIGIDIWAPKLIFLKSYELYTIYILFLIANSLFSITNSSFIAMQKSTFYMLQNLIVGCRIFFLPFFLFLGIFGIFGAYGISFIISALFVYFIMFKLGINAKFSLDFMFLRRSIGFSTGNYLINILALTPSLLLPIIIFNTLGAKESANYYIAFSVASLLFIIPNAASTSFLVECSHGKAMRKAIKKSLAISFMFLIPGIAIICITSNLLLGFINPAYILADNLLKVLALSGIFLAVFSIYISVLRVNKKNKELILLNIITFSLIIGLSYNFMNIFGLIGVGYAWLIAYVIGDLIIFYRLIKKLIKGF